MIQCWALLIIYTNIVTGERLRKEPFLSTRPAQLSYRVLSSILLLGSGCCVVLFYLHWGHAFVLEKPPVSDMGVGLTYDTSLGGDADTLGSKAEMFFGFIRRVMSQIPYVGTTSSAGNLLYATACSMVVANMFLPSSLFRPSPKRERFGAEEVSAEREKKLLGTDKRFVVSLAKATHTWRVFPLPMRSHYLLSQHTLKENLQIVGTFQLVSRGSSASNAFPSHRSSNRMATSICTDSNSEEVPSIRAGTLLCFALNWPAGCWRRHGKPITQRSSP